MAGVVFNANGAKPPLPLEEYDPPPPENELTLATDSLVLAIKVALTEELAARVIEQVPVPVHSGVKPVEADQSEKV